ncbi:MAG: hypothetical protein IJM03_02530 [Treponema sp.]|nr:hypothetical protein [Treponema sp.]
MPFVTGFPGFRGSLPAPLPCGNGNGLQVTLPPLQSRLGWVQNVRFTGNTGKNTGYGTHQAVIVFNKCRNIDFSGNTFTNPDHSGVTKVYYSFKDSPYTKNVSDQNNSWGW